MIIPDINLLVYAVYKESPQHRQARQWLDTLMVGDEPVGLPWIVILGFLRITTNARVLSKPWSVTEAAKIIDRWLALRTVSIVEPSERHWSILRGLLIGAGRGANLTSDAYLAALCIERGAALHSADNDFARFKTLRWVNPLAVE